jgi:predicted esterase
MGFSEKTIETVTHGRYLVDVPQPGLPILVGFHGYAESAEIELERLRAIDALNRWIALSVQGLHRFYRGRSTDVVASWMTRQNREVAIADNIRYAAKVIDTVAKEYSASTARVFTGFSQGVAMAFRSATAPRQPVHGVIALGGDIPPELDSSSLSCIQTALIGRGIRDEWYTAEKLAADEGRLSDAGVKVQVVSFDAVHEWTSGFSQAAARFLYSI